MTGKNKKSKTAQLFSIIFVYTYKGGKMKNRIILILLIISLGLNIGTFSILIYDKLNDNADSRLFFEEDGDFKSIDLTDKQIKSIDSMRFKWFESNDSLKKRIFIMENSLDTIGLENSGKADSISKIIKELEDSLELSFVDYIDNYENILDTNQYQVFIKQVSPKIKFLKIRISSDSTDSNADVKIIKKIEIEKEEK